MNALVAPAKAALARLFDEYRINWIVAADAAPPPGGPEPVALSAPLAARVAQSPTPKFRNTLSFAHAGLEGLALCGQGRPLCVAHFARADRYDRAATWPLGANEVALIDIATEDAARGHGLAPALIRAATRHYLEGGASRVIAFVWWSNTPSLRAFAKAGWRRIGLSLEWRRGETWRSLRIPFRDWSKAPKT